MIKINQHNIHVRSVSNTEYLRGFTQLYRPYHLKHIRKNMRLITARSSINKIISSLHRPPRHGCSRNWALVTCSKHCGEVSSGHQAVPPSRMALVQPWNVGVDCRGVLSRFWWILVELNVWVDYIFFFREASLHFSGLEEANRCKPWNGELYDSGRTHILGM